MADFAEPLSTNDFLYNGKVYFTNPHQVFKETIVAKLLLTSDNFNFDLAQEDGRDFRLVDGVDTLRMWIAYWSQSNKQAVLFFKLQNIGAGASVSFKAYWGNSNIEKNSEPDKMDLLFYEEFSGSSISSSKWSGGLTNGSSSYGYSLSDTFTSITDPLKDQTSWVVEAGFYCGWSAVSSSWQTDDRAVGFGLIGTENNIIINIMHDDRIRHQAVEPGGGTYSYSIKSYGGLEGPSQNDCYISYYEPEDKITVKFENRKTFNNVAHTIYRKVEGDTRPNNITLYERDFYGARPTYINWLVIREYSEFSLGSLDGSELYIPYETVNHQVQDYREYGPDITSTLYSHESDFGGNPYLLSNDQHDADSSVWISDAGASSETQISVTIHTGWYNTQLVNNSYRHYDSGHVYYYNASKLSNQDYDRMGRDFWQCTTTSGWAAIKFPSSRRVGAFRVKFTETAGTEPKDYSFLGSNFYPETQMSLAKTIDSGTFDNTTEWQSRKIAVPSLFKYYILDVKNTYGDENIRIQEWQMFDALGNSKIYPSQLRLCPATYSNYMDNFPKEILFEGSLDGISWTTLIPWTYTYTPYVEHYNGYGYWQRYSFTNNVGFWSFRLCCRGNWGAVDGRIIIGEWSIHEFKIEENVYRILDGTSNNVSQIWASDNCGFDDVYSLIYTTNDKLNIVNTNKLVSSKDLPEYYVDINVI